MDRRKLLLKMSEVAKKKTNYEKFSELFAVADQLFYLQLDDTSGTTATDLTGNAIHGTYAAAVSLANSIAPSGKPCPYFDGVNGTYVNFYSAALNTLMVRTEGTLRILAKATATEWTDGAARYAICMMDGSSRKVNIGKSATNDTLGFDYTTETRTPGSMSDTDWMYLAITFSKTNNEIKVYKDGLQLMTTAAFPATEMSGNLTSVSNKIGHMRSDTSQNPWKGWLADAMALKRAATVAEIAQDYLDCINP